MFNYVNNQRYDSGFEIKQLTDYLSSHKNTNILLCASDTLPASLFYSALNTFEEAHKLHLFVSPMMLEQKALEPIGKPFQFVIHGYTSWLASFQNAGNQDFIDACLQQPKKIPTLFSLLGWETGLIMRDILLQGYPDFSNGTELAMILSSFISKSSILISSFNGRPVGPPFAYRNCSEMNRILRY